MRKQPVLIVKEKDSHDSEFWAQHPGRRNSFIISESLLKLKKFVRDETRIGLIWICCKNGCFSYGQNLVDAYPYRPRRNL